MHHLIVTVLLVGSLLPMSVSVQGAPRTISPGMSRAAVVAALGAPATARTVSEFTYLFYRNSCGTRCGMNDLVVLRRDSVVDAIFRSPSRRYTGTSSSPAPISASEAARRRPTSAGANAPVQKPAPRMRPPAEASDIRPSIPVNPPTMPPSSSTQPSPGTP